ncbi:MAG TPA: GGDEF domain-containing protein [Pseudonocardiaceae bacterium]|nr:GGDEF domain-containing protein [Pseudonocardiaceae bacterium]
MPALLHDVHVVYQPVFNLHTGGVMAVEAKAKPANGSVRSLLRHAADTGQLTPTDYGLAGLAIRRAAGHDTRIPLHVNLLAVSVGRAHVALGPLLDAVRETGRRPADVVLELNPPFSSVRWAAFRQGVTVLREAGFRLAVDKIGDGDAPVALLAWPEIDLIKLDRSLAAGAPHEARLRAAVESMVALSERADLRLVAEGITEPRELETLHGLGVHLAQGDLLHPAGHRPSTHVTIAPLTGDPLAVAVAEQPDRIATPKVTELMHPATTLPATATADDVRTVFAADQEASCVVLLDDSGRPEWTIDRNRFLLAVTGPYGHALHAKRTARRLADKPRVVPVGATVFDLLDVLSGAERSRGTDDVIVVDAACRCLGVVRATDLVRAVADSKVEAAAALNPLTRLPGSSSVDRSVTRRIRDGDVFAVGWLDIDAFKTVNDRFGFAAGDDLIRDVGRCLAEAAENQPDIRVSHIGGDDFVFVSALDHLMPLASRLIDTPWAVDGAPVSLSLATLVCAAGSVTTYREVSRQLAPLKSRAKSISGSSWVVGRPGSDRADVMRSGQGRSRPVPPPSVTATLPRRTPGRHTSAKAG